MDASSACSSVRSVSMGDSSLVYNPSTSASTGANPRVVFTLKPTETIASLTVTSNGGTGDQLRVGGLKWTTS